MSYNDKGRFQNSVRMDSHKKNAGRDIALAKVPASEHYREELQPFIGTCIEVVGNMDVCERRTKYTRILLKKVSVHKVPLKVRNKVPSSEIDHLYIAVSNDYIRPDNSHVRVRGFVYEYLSQGKKNIGMKAVTIREIQNEET